MDCHDRAAPWRTLEPDRAAMKFCGPARDRQTETSAAGFGRKERLEDPVANLERNARTLVADVDPTDVAFAREGHLHRPATVHCLRRVQQHVQKGPAQQ